MQVGDLVKDNFGNVGLIIARCVNPCHFRIQWCGEYDGYENSSTMHHNHLEVICK